MADTSLISESSAKQIVELLLRHSGECHDLAAHLHIQTSLEAFRQYGPIIGAVMAGLNDEGLKPLFALYPHLKPDGFP